MFRTRITTCFILARFQEGSYFVPGLTHVVARALRPDGTVRWYALIGAAAWTSIGGRMGMFVYVADNMTGPPSLRQHLRLGLQRAHS